MNAKVLVVVLFLFSSVSNASGGRCAEVFKMLVPKTKALVKIQTIDGQSYSVRAATKQDIPSVTILIHNAFEIWKKEGLQLSPMTQTEEQTSSHLLNKGFVAEDSNGKIVATFSLEDGVVSKSSDGKVQFVEGADSPTIFSPLDQGAVQTSGQFLIFKKAAVQSDLANSGLGAQLYQIAENLGRENGYAGMILETVKEAHWLYDWYVRLGFQPIGIHRYPGSPVDTVLMAKPFIGGAK